MVLRAMSAGDVPAAPTFVKGGAMVRHERMAVLFAGAAGGGMHGTNQESGDRQGDGPLVTAETIVPADEHGLQSAGGVQAVEDHTLLGIERGQLQRVTILNVADARIVIEINCTRRAGGDAFGLNTRSGKNQHLRVGADVKLLEQSGQIAPAVRRVVELELSASEALDETPHGIGGRIRVLDGGMIQRDEESVFEAIRQQPSGSGE